MKTSRKSKIQIGLLLLPGLLVFGIFTIYPILKLFIMSFFEWDFGSMLSHRFIGLENYKEVLGDEYFRTVFINSFGIYACDCAGTDAGWIFSCTFTESDYTF